MYQENRRRHVIRVPKRAVLNISLRKLPRRASHVEVGPSGSDVAGRIASRWHFCRSELLRPIHSKKTSGQIRPPVNRHNSFITLALGRDPKSGKATLAE